MFILFIVAVLEIRVINTKYTKYVEVGRLDQRWCTNCWEIYAFDVLGFVAQNWIQMKNSSKASQNKHLKCSFESCGWRWIHSNQMDFLLYLSLFSLSSSLPLDLFYLVCQRTKKLLLNFVLFVNNFFCCFVFVLILDFFSTATNARLAKFDVAGSTGVRENFSLSIATFLLLLLFALIKSAFNLQWKTHKYKRYIKWFH